MKRYYLAILLILLLAAYLRLANLDWMIFTTDEIAQVKAVQEYLKGNFLHNFYVFDQPPLMRYIFTASFALFGFSETFFRQIIGYTSIFVTAGAALLIAILYHPLVRAFQNITDRLFFRGRYDYQKTLREISQKIASVIRLEELTKLIVSSFIDTTKVSEIPFILQEKETEHFRTVNHSLPR